MEFINRFCQPPQDPNVRILLWLGSNSNCRWSPGETGKKSQDREACYYQPPSYCFFQAIVSHQAERQSIKALMQKVINMNPRKI